MNTASKKPKLTGVKLEKDNFDWDVEFDDDDDEEVELGFGSGEIDIQARMEEILNGKSTGKFNHTTSPRTTSTMNDNKDNVKKAERSVFRDKGKEKEKEQENEKKENEKESTTSKEQLKTNPKKPASKFFRLNKNAPVDEDEVRFFCFLAIHPQFTNDCKLFVYIIFFFIFLRGQLYHFILFIRYSAIINTPFFFKSEVVAFDAKDLKPKKVEVAASPTYFSLQPDVSEGMKAQSYQ